MGFWIGRLIALTCDGQEQKVTLSEQCVQVLITASFQPLLRRHLRREAEVQSHSE